MTALSDERVDSYLHTLDGRHGNPYVAMRERRTREMLLSVIPRSARHLDAALVDDAVSRFWSSEGPHTRFYREAALIAARGLRDAIPSSWWRELIDYEYLRWEVGYLPSDGQAKMDAAFEWTMALHANSTLRWMRCEYAVHEEFDRVPTRTPTFLSIHRNDDDSTETRWMGAFEYEFLVALNPQTSALETLRIGVEKRKAEERESYIYRVSDFVGQMLQSKALFAATGSS